MASPLKVGITGGIGSGKTTVCKIFEILGIPIYYADESAKKLMEDDPELRKSIREEFGEESYGEDGRLNRAYLAGKVFRDEEQLKKLNALVHPAVARDSKAWHARQKEVSYTLKEAALLFESGSFRELDYLITVYAPKEIRIARVVQRDGADRQAVLDRMARQWPEAEKVAKADYVILNDGEHFLVPQVLEIHRQLSKGN